MVLFGIANVVSYRLSIVTIRPQFAIECLRRLNQQEVGHFGTKFGKERVDRCKPNFNVFRKRHRAVYAKEIAAISSVV